MTYKNNSAAKIRHDNKYTYSTLVVLAIACIWQKQFASAVICAAIALAFDPFNQQIKFNNRPIWQKAWLVLHLAAVMLLVGLGFKH